jgi:glucose-1-phosphate cytidylyltransferase
MSHQTLPPVAILAGGLGSRLSELTAEIPKPMVQIGGRPILWHIMKTYACFGHRDFFVALGYRGEVIQDYFCHLPRRGRDFVVQTRSGEVRYFDDVPTDDWQVGLIETGLHTMTGGRVKQLAARIGPRTFMMTYGDGVCDVDLAALLAFHRSHGKLATITAVRPTARFGALRIDGGGIVTSFEEKPGDGEGWINGGFFVLEPEVVEFITGDNVIFEQEPLMRLAEQGELVAYQHAGFWQCMDTLRDVRTLESLWSSGAAPWRSWNS